MPCHNNSRIVIATVLAAACCGSTVHAGQDIVNATGNCNGALPAYEGALRKRPLGIANEGASNAFANCSLNTNAQPNTGYSVVAAFLVNRRATAVNVTCTYVDGAVAELGEFPAQYYPQTLSASPGVITSFIWRASDFALTKFSPLANFTCNLPPQVEINTITGVYPDPL